MKCDNAGKPAGCMRMSSTKTCLGCNEGMNYTVSSMTCAEQATKVENCAIYTNGVCGLCKGEFNIVAGACVKAAAIANCTIYGVVGQCARCGKGFRLASDVKSCIADVWNGCTSVTVPCPSCDYAQGYWATDYDLAKGNICTYTAKTLSAAAVITLLLALLR